MSSCEPCSWRRDVNTFGIVPSGTYKSGAIEMSTPHFTERPANMDILDFWTQISLDAYWKELVKETQKADFTGRSLEDCESDTGSTDWLYLINLKNRLPWEPKTGFPPESAKSADLHPKSEKFDYTCSTGIKFFGLLVVIPITLLSPQVRIKKTPLDFWKKGIKKKSFPNLENFSLIFFKTLFEKILGKLFVRTCGLYYFSLIL